MEPDGFELVPAFLSSIAAGLSAFTAIKSYKVAREAKTIAERGILAEHHSEAVDIFIDTLSGYKEISSEVFEKANYLITDWQRLVDQYDDTTFAGDNPRPLRHVLLNLGRMLASYAIEKSGFERFSDDLDAVIFHGLPEGSAVEYAALMLKGDHKYAPYEETFGTINIRQQIKESDAFKFGVYQLKNRLSEQSLKEYLQSSWSEGGALAEYHKLVVSLNDPLDRLKWNLDRLRLKLHYSPYKLEDNPQLNLKVDDLVVCIDVLKECSLERVCWASEKGKATSAVSSCKDDYLEELVYISAMLQTTIKISNKFFSLKAPD